MPRPCSLRCLPRQSPSGDLATNDCRQIIRADLGHRLPPPAKSGAHVSTARRLGWKPTSHPSDGRHSRSIRGAVVSGCTSISTCTTSRAPRSSRFSANFSAICADRLSCCGTEGKFIGVGTSRLFAAAIPGPCAYHAGCALRWHASSSPESPFSQTERLLSVAGNVTAEFVPSCGERRRV